MAIRPTLNSKYLLLIAALLQVLSLQVAAQDAFQEIRIEMVRTTIEARGVTDVRVLEEMRKVPRHRFVYQSLRSRAYEDRPLPIGFDQTISQPYIVAVMTEQLQTEAHHKVLEIGTGSGYQAAVLSGLVDEVYTIEIVQPLGERAARDLEANGYDNVSVRIGDGYQGWPEQAPFDRIIVTAAPEQIPQALIDQLKPGGRMILPLGSQQRAQDLTVVEKDLAGNVSTETLMRVLFVPMVRDETQ